MAATRDYVVFLLNGERHEVPGSVPPTRTLLEYLREDLGLKGTKEGCNEGDCGACTVVVMEPEQRSTLAVNACILLVPMLDGKSVTTIDGLLGPSGELHPCQQAMLECHGSQCGFCTPGFVMSLFAMYQDVMEYHDGKPPTKKWINTVLAGNLCRCTGYGSIVAAAERMFALPRPEWDVSRQAVNEFRAIGLRSKASLAVKNANGQFYAPLALVELIELRRIQPDSIILGGATDVGLWANKQLRPLPILISTARVGELQQFSHGVGRMRIGAAVTYEAAWSTLEMFWPNLGELIRRLGSEQVRNSGTIGGNIANGSPIGDMPPALMALGSTLVLNGPEGQRRMPLEEFFLAYGKQDRKPGEFVEAVEIPIPAPEVAGHRLRCYKISKRFDQDISAVLGCFYLHIDNGVVTSARIAFGGMAGIPKRAKAVEAALEANPWTMATVEAAMPKFERDFQPLSDARASKEYRMLTAKNLLVRYFHEMTSDVQTRLVGDGERIIAEVMA